MGCNKDKGDCRPCLDCKDPVPPIMPRCQDVVLAKGVYTNATVTVNEQGCIVALANGDPLLYSPDPCCQTPGGGGGSGGAGLKGDKGDPGKNATISIGSVTSVAADQPARVINTGDVTNAVLNFEIPRGKQGEESNVAPGLTMNENGVKIENGIIKEVPLGWPGYPNLMGGTANDMTVNIAFDKEVGSATFTVDPSEFRNGIMEEIKKVRDELAVAKAETDKLKQRVAVLEGRLASGRG